MRRLIAGAVLVLVLVLVLSPATAAPRRLPDIPGCGRSDRADLVVGYLVCAVNTINAQQVALDARFEQIERRAAASDAHIGAIAWQKAGDRLFLWQQESAAYTDRFLYDQMYARMKVHVCRMGIPHNATVRCP